MLGILRCVASDLSASMVTRSTATVTDERIRSLDGLRALACLAVLIHHTIQIPYLPGGVFAPWSLASEGVRLFFVLSGFLITGILLRARESSNLWSAWRVFYIRRALRIFPLAYLVILIAWVISIDGVREHPWRYLTYTSNFFDSQPGAGRSGIVHFWSLAIEEQFYLVWPAFILWTPTRLLMPAIVAVIVGAGLFRLWVFEPDWYVGAYHFTLARLDTLAYGALLALKPIAWWKQAGVGVACLAAAQLHGTAVLFGEWAAIALSGALIHAALSVKAWIAVLSVRPLVWVGTISYGVYVLHAPIPEVLRMVGLSAPEPGLWRLLVVGGTAIGLASISWLLYERPLNNLKHRWPYPHSGRQDATYEAVTSHAG